MPGLSETDGRFSRDRLQPRPWADVEAALDGAERFFITTVRPGGQPHTCPLPAVWHDGALHIATGATEQKARNIARNPQVTLVTGNGSEREWFDW
ncbi:MAG TPA: pyridoxamine 5'-phosphate oxidase family protein [Thermomicrobiales bacterium]|jgi:nitroimidazol reductase NimA-like FMN-containing flavoprotein (pyridoxamine 5'-phosphate oxidase superfamily)|nr:pyridoxamine 5'-phosphate oxidase family protein [Thermomicrobiales bacterium]